MCSSDCSIGSRQKISPIARRSHADRKPRKYGPIADSAKECTERDQPAPDDERAEDASTKLASTSADVPDLQHARGVPAP